MNRDMFPDSLNCEWCGENLRHDCRCQETEWADESLTREMEAEDAMYDAGWRTFKDCAPDRARDLISQITA